MNFMDQELLSLLKQMVEIPSVYFDEKKILDFCYDYLKNEGFDVFYHKYDSFGLKSGNIVVHYKGKNPGKHILLNGHLDTVKVCKGWDTDPFKVKIDGNKMYGIGALDMKNGSCAIMYALKKFKDQYLDNFDGEITLALVSDEEGPYGLGCNALIEEGLLKDIDVAVVPEPSAGFSKKQYPVLCIGARGSMVYQVEFFGKSAHASHPELGLNAMVEAGKFIVESSKLKLETDNLLGPGSFNILKCEADGGACSVIDYAHVTVHRHMNSLENEETVFNEARKLIKDAGVNCPTNLRYRPYPSEGSKCYPAYIVDKNNEYVKAFAESVKEATGLTANIDILDSIGDFNYIGKRIKNKNGEDVPTLIFGADGEQIHGSNECLYIDTFDKTFKSIYRFLEKELNVK